MKMLSVNLKTSSYNVYFETGAVSDELTSNKLAMIFQNEIGIDKHTKIAIISDDNVYFYYGDIVKNSLQNRGYRVYDYSFKSGESSKNINTALNIISELSKWQFSRKDIVVALGGGVVGDVAGFVASVYMRGIEYIQIPTSLIAQADSSLGGKTAVDTSFGKNLIGSFHQPKSVIVDVNCLKTLKSYYFRDGMGEVAKYAFIDEECDIWELLLIFSQIINSDREECLLNNSQSFVKLATQTSISNSIKSIIYECCKSKIKYIQADEMDRGQRMVLNFGHTIGHSIEAASEYKFSHGVCVAVGMHIITEFAEHMGWSESGTSHKVKQLLNQLDLIDERVLQYAFLNSDKWLSYIKNDKKNDLDFINLIVLKSLGNPVIKRVKLDDFIRELRIFGDVYKFI